MRGADQPAASKKPQQPAADAAELVATGTELLNGRTVNRHPQILARYLATIGLRLVRETTAPDDLDAIVDALDGALQRADIVFTTGGLGPTADDITRDAVARHLGRGIVMDEPSRETIRRRCEAAGIACSEQRERQALVVEGAEALPNSVGAASGEMLEWKGKLIFLLPGPPAEFEAVLRDELLPRLRKRLGPLAAPAEKIFVTCGIAEADIIARFEKEGFPPEGIEVAYCAAAGRVEVRLSAPASAASEVEAAAARVRELLGDNVFAEERVDLEEVVGRLLRERRATLATAESCTGGLVGHRITSISGSSDYYRGGVVAYSDDVKIAALGVDARTLGERGTVSEAVAVQMATGVRERLRADFGIGITGIAGPTGGTPQKPVGLVYIAVADPRGTQVREFRFPGDRATIRERACLMALDMLRRRLLGVE